MMELKGVINESYYPDGNLKECRLEEHNEISTEAGVLVPKYQIFDTRTKYRNALEFYESGKLKSVYLQEPQEVETPSGKFKAEMVTFYEEGSVHRVFPLYGQISGYWSESDEYELAEPIFLDLESVQISGKVICLCFYPSGKIKSITLWSIERIKAKTIYGVVIGRLGIAFYENGKIKSLEPLYPAEISTPIGVLLAYDNNPIGIHGDDNSLCFNEDGSVKSLITSVSWIEIIGLKKTERIAPELVPSQIDPEKKVMASIKVEFDEEKVTITDVKGQQHSYELDKYDFYCSQVQLEFLDSCNGICDGCSGCFE